MIGLPGGGGITGSGILGSGPIFASLVAHAVKHLHAIQETQVQTLDWEDPLEKGMATHSSIPACPGFGLYSIC